MCVSQIRTSQEIKLRCILIKLTRPSWKSTARFWQFTTTVCRTAHNVSSSKIQNDLLSSLGPLKSWTQHIVGTGGTDQHATQCKTQCTTSQKSAGLTLLCDRKPFVWSIRVQMTWIATVTPIESRVKSSVYQLDSCPVGMNRFRFSGKSRIGSSIFPRLKLLQPISCCW